MTAKRTHIDLRSDTVTQPTAGMRAAMAAAVTGDDTYGEDPTTNQLQEITADLLGKEAALYVPSGTMANQIAIKLLTNPGESIVVGAQSHNWMFEAGAIGFISSAQVIVLPGDGRYTAEQLRASALPDQEFFSKTSAISVENTHNMGGGVLWEEGTLQQVLNGADELGLAKHLDGARLWNAAVASRASLAKLASRFDTVSVCLSKGLGAPVGSMLAGSADLIRKARKLRRILGGGMRQCGIVAAGGLYGIENHRARLADDHANAKRLAQGLNAIPGIEVDMERTQTNFVMAHVVDDALDTVEIVQMAAQRGVHFLQVAPKTLRLVTHLDVSRADCERAVAILDEMITNRQVLESSRKQ